MNLPEEINIIEVGPRDGFQNIKEFIIWDYAVLICTCTQAHTGVRINTL